MEGYPRTLSLNGFWSSSFRVKTARNLGGEYEKGASLHSRTQKGYYSPLALPPALRDRWGQGITSPQKPSAVLPRAVMPVHGTGRVRRLLLVGVPAAASELPAGAFGDRAALKAAVDAWVADPAAAEATHGSISGWDTSRVDDMSGCLLYTSPSPRDQRGARMPSSA